MAKKKIIFQGEPGANSHLACREAYPDHEPIPCPTFEDCFSALVAGDVDLGMIPIENSVAGRVADIHHLMPTSGLHIIAEWFLPIRNQLMAPKGASLKTIKTVQSHVMALGQCRNIIRELKLKPVVAADTAGSAREVAEAKDITRAAIASRLASEIYGLDILKENVEDELHSTTRFVVLSREKKWAQPGKGKVVTTFVFRVRNVPAALYKALGGFATNGVNMTKLESYMVGGNFFATQFYADVEGHPDDRALVFALEELAFFSKELRCSGSIPPTRSAKRSRKRRTSARPAQTATRPRNPSMPRCSLVAAASTVSDASSTLLAALRVSPTASRNLIEHMRPFPWRHAPRSPRCARFRRLRCLAAAAKAPRPTYSRRFRASARCCGGSRRQ